MNGTNPVTLPQREPHVLREHATWTIIDKPPRWHTLAKTVPGTVFSHETEVETWLKHRFAWAKPLDEAGIVHRLDYETSGCLLVAKSAAEQQRLREMFQRDDSAIRKIYLAIVEPGLPDSGEFRLFFTSRYKRSKKVTVRDAGDPRNEGRCRWRVLRCQLSSPSGSKSPLGDKGAGREGEFAEGELIEIQLLGPGRRHQIRAGLAFLGHPLVGDHLYGGQTPPPSQREGATEWMQRGSNHQKDEAEFFLHAWKLTVDGVETTAPMPDHWPAIA